MLARLLVFARMCARESGERGRRVLIIRAEVLVLERRILNANAMRYTIGEHEHERAHTHTHIHTCLRSKVWFWSVELKVVTVTVAVAVILWFWCKPRLLFFVGFKQKGVKRLVCNVNRERWC